MADSQRASSPLGRLEVNANRETFEAITRQRTLRGEDATETVRRAIALLDYLTSVSQSGGEAFVVDSEGKRNQLMLL